MSSVDVLLGKDSAAALWLGGAGTTVAATIAALLMIGGALRNRLRRLAHAAQRLSAGKLEPTAVAGLGDWQPSPMHSTGQ
jgi:hypothetical protein